jgi:hypothetical protein
VTTAKLTRRTLTFATLDDVVRDTEHLLAVGYDRIGKWDLAQCCGHLAEWFRYQMDGYPKPPLLVRPVFWLIRNTVGKRLGRKMFAGGSMKTGLPTIPQSVPAPGGDDAAGVARLRETIGRWKAHTGPLHASPLFGGMSREAWTKGHLIHCAHHLSFLVPRT